MKNKAKVDKRHHKMSSLASYEFVNEKTFILIFNDEVKECGSETKCANMLDKIVNQWNRATGQEIYWTDLIISGRAELRLLERDDLMLRSSELREWLDLDTCFCGKKSRNA